MANVWKGEPFGLYRPEFEHSACGVGVVANVRGVKSNEVVRNGLEVLTNLAHRGAAGSDPETGDGAGMLLQMPHDFLRRETAKLGIDLPGPGGYAAGVVFLPQDSAEREACEAIVVRATEQEGQRFLGWRDVPVDPSVIGYVARECQPVIRQLFIGMGPGSDSAAFERKLFVIRKVAEREVLDAGLSGGGEFYVCSLSSKLVVYKGLLMGTQLGGFYKDLADPLVASSFALVHSRFSTNTLGSWKLAHPYRYIVHNGEINTLRGNINWMVARQNAMASPEFGDDLDKLFPIIWPGQSDTACIDNAYELMLHTGRPLHHTMMALIPEATGPKVQMSQDKRDFYDYHACLVEPWDGPALIAFTDGDRVGAVLDRNGLRPFRYLVTTDDTLVMASEVGVLDIPPEKVLFQGAHSPRTDVPDGPGARRHRRRRPRSSRSCRRDSPTASGCGTTWCTWTRFWTPSPAATVAMSSTRSRWSTCSRRSGIHKRISASCWSRWRSTARNPPAPWATTPPWPYSPIARNSCSPTSSSCFAQVSNPPLDAIREELVDVASASTSALSAICFEEDAPSRSSTPAAQPCPHGARPREDQGGRPARHQGGDAVAPLSGRRRAGRDGPRDGRSAPRRVGGYRSWLYDPRPSPTGGVGSASRGYPQPAGDRWRASPPHSRGRAHESGNRRRER